MLALADSDHPGEALSALRAARVILNRSGLTFGDLVGLLSDHSAPRVNGDHAQVPATTADRRFVEDLETRLRSMERTMERQQGELDRHRTEADRWRRLAQETADKLWDLGKALERQHDRPGLEDRRRLLLEHLRDPNTARLSDREIARRVGAPLPAVTYWRRRLFLEQRRRHLRRVVQRGRLMQGVWMRPVRGLD